MPNSQTTNDRTRRTRIAELNDQLRTTLDGGRVMMTTGVQGRGAAFIAKATASMRAFTKFGADIELGITRATLYRHVSPTGALHDDGKKIVGR